MQVVSGSRARGAELARAGRLSVRLAATAAEIEAAQRLRWRVFAGELGARLATDRDGLDRDAFDAHCHHLVVEDESRGEIVGTYRAMLPDAARRIGRLYIETEFDVDGLAPIRDGLVELGRSCVHADYRSGATIMLLWSGLGSLLAGAGCRHVIGCASVPMADGGRQAADLFVSLNARHAAPGPFGVRPRDPLPVAALATGADVPVPPLVKGYLRAGGRLVGEPHVDRAFGCVDFPMMLAIDEADDRYTRRFIRAR